MTDIKHRFTDEVICSGETIVEAVTNNLAYLSGADLRGAYLRDADLSGAYLRGADLRDADLSGADLSDAYLRGADLRDADLSGADLRGADLRDADLRGADLRDADLSGADLSGAYLSGARMAWSSHDLIAELLKRSAGDDVAKLKVAGYILICHEKCWSDFVRIRDPLMGWAVDVLREYITDGDEHPALLDKE